MTLGHLFIPGHHKHKHIHTFRVANPTIHVLGGARKLENPEETHTYTLGLENKCNSTQAVI